MTNRDDSKPLSTHPCISVYEKQALNFIPVYTDEKADNFFINQGVRPGFVNIGPQTFRTGWLRAEKEISLCDLDPSLVGKDKATLSLEDVVIKSFLIEASGEYLVINFDPPVDGGYNLRGVKQGDKNIVFNTTSKLRIFKEEQHAENFRDIHDVFAARVRFDVAGSLDLNSFTIQIGESPVQFKGLQFISYEKKYARATEIVKDYLADAKLVGYELAATFTFEKIIS